MQPPFGFLCHLLLKIADTEDFLACKWFRKSQSNINVQRASYLYAPFRVN